MTAIRSTGVRVAGDLLGPAREALDRCERRPGDKRSEPGGQCDAGRRDDGEDDEDVAQRVVDLCERPRDLHRTLPGPSARVSTRTCVSATSVLTSSLAGARAARCAASRRDVGQRRPSAPAGRSTVPSAQTICT